MASSRTVQVKAARVGGGTERRGRPRAKLRQPIRIRSENALVNGFEEITTTVNMSRDGVYFTTRRDSYFPRLHVLAVCPYNPATPVGPADERRAEVVRVDSLPGGLRGVALSFGGKLEVQH
jgi:hypothetical protein